MEKSPTKNHFFNSFASILGRFSVRNIDTDSILDLNTTLEYQLNFYEDSISNTPDIFSNMPEAIDETIIFDNKLLKQIHTGPFSLLSESSSMYRLNKIITDHKESCSKMKDPKAKHQLFLDPLQIESSLGLDGMWNETEAIVTDEILKYGIDTQHPKTPIYLDKLTNLDITNDLIEFSKEKILHYSGNLSVDSYITENPEYNHLYWSAKSYRLDYATPRNYNIATQLSFDMPHNVAHLIHLEKLPLKKDINRYTDGLRERAYFEAVAVLSEYIIMQLATEYSDVFMDMTKIFGIELNEKSAIELTNWIYEDRRYEFKLRAARLLADKLHAEGANFIEIINEVSKRIGINKTEALAETKKYLPWIGLGAAYTFGYRKLLSNGIDDINQAITINQNVITNWTDFEIYNK